MSEVLAQQIGQLQGAVEGLRGDIHNLTTTVRQVTGDHEKRLVAVEVQQAVILSKGSVYARALDWFIKGIAGAVLGLVIKHFLPT